MKLLILITLLVFPLLAEANQCGAALSSTMTKRYGCYQFLVRFPWGTCRTHYCAARKNPPVIKGYACGVYTVCRRIRNNRYACRF